MRPDHRLRLLLLGCSAGEIRGRSPDRQTKSVTTAQPKPPRHKPLSPSAPDAQVCSTGLASTTGRQLSDQVNFVPPPPPPPPSPPPPPLPLQ
ncbi:unnamed protein product [Protopolystoma xenopodis]|uniref:Uncharacterized protein n=1 Tax=Protopolystoma xenopodis TaxID=117903 RepID=A0A3S5B705_9PLAT|nr:unnamed protein product [Protopolystoma xenopodis]